MEKCKGHLFKLAENLFWLCGWDFEVFKITDRILEKRKCPNPECKINMPDKIKIEKNVKIRASVQFKINNSHDWIDIPDELI